MKQITLALLMLATTTSHAGTPVERYRQQNETQQLILTEQPCTAFPNPNHYTLFKAYALNVPTSEQYEGCWELLNDGRVHINIIIPERQSVFEFFYPQQDFELRPNL